MLIKFRVLNFYMVYAFCFFLIGIFCQSLLEVFPSFPNLNSITFSKLSFLGLKNFKLNLNGEEVKCLVSLEKNEFYFPEKSLKSSENCYYTGSVIKLLKKNHFIIVNKSLVALSICRGLRGIISVNNFLYHVTSLDGKYFLFEEKAYKKGFNPAKYQLNKRNANKPIENKMSVPYGANKATLYVELFVVNDKSQYDSFDQNENRVIERTKDIVNIVNSLFRALNIYVALVGVEIWKNGDLIVMSRSTNLTLENFLKYRTNNINPRIHNDIAFLFTSFNYSNEDHSTIVGRAPIMTMCSYTASGGLAFDHKQPLGRVATIVAHELGHNLGMGHDGEGSTCEGNMCIMSPYISNKTATKWSSSSVEDFNNAKRVHIDHCLHNLPNILNVGQTCGNGFVEENEECDCGLPQDCSSPCCEPETCKLKNKAQCASGLCCDVDLCQLKPSHQMCRPSSTPCDLPEYCSGKSALCPFDIYKHNGFPCEREGIKAFCMDGKCNTHDSQCKLIWGFSGKQAEEVCYKKNLFSNVSGHCGYEINPNKFKYQFKPCNKSNILCGLLHCEHRNEKPVFWKNSTIYSLVSFTYEYEEKQGMCSSVLFDMGDDENNQGMTPNGASCGPNMMCFYQKCKNVSDLLNCPDCHGNGICNSLGQCHCNKGFEPPLCDKQGSGGSLHSNPIHPHAVKIVWKKVGLLLLGGIILSCFLFCTIFLAKRRFFSNICPKFSNFFVRKNTKEQYKKQKYQFYKEQNNQKDSTFNLNASVKNLNQKDFTKNPVNRHHQIPPPRPPKMTKSLTTKIFKEPPYTLKEKLDVEKSNLSDTKKQKEDKINDNIKNMTVKSFQPHRKVQNSSLPSPLVFSKNIISENPEFSEFNSTLFSTSSKRQKPQGKPPPPPPKSHIKPF